MRDVMAENRAAEAIARIERALDRIEAVAATPRGGDELMRLRETHEVLRGKVEGAITQIDRLLQRQRG